MKYKYSGQAKLVIDNLKDFDETDFTLWFENQIVVGGGHLIQYLEQKGIK